MSAAPLPPVSDATLLESARRAVSIEAAAVDALVQKIDQRFADACRACLACQGRVVVTGMGKSGHIAGKIAATLASTGTPAFFLHPAEAGHGDLGMITRTDVVLAISNSGETPELVLLLPHLKRLAVPLIVMTGAPDATLGKAASVVLDVSVPEEACPLNLAPTASTTATLAMGDALAVALLDARGFRSDDFAMHHPGGSLGRRLLVHVEDIMRKGDRLPRNAPDALLPEAIVEMSRKGMGMTCIVDAGDKLLGIYTDGDLRRTLERHDSIRNLRVADVMTRGPTTIAAGRLAVEAAQLLEARDLGGKLVVTSPEGKLVGALTFHDLLAAGVV